MSDASDAVRSGLPQVDLSLPSGEKAYIALHGAHVLSWQTADGRERLYLSPRALLDGQSPIRGGIPICFPQFNQRVLGAQALPKHGFARNLPWQLARQNQTDFEASAILTLSDSPATRAFWPVAFSAEYELRLTPGQLQVEFSVRNTDSVAWPFALALHTYLCVADIAQTQLLGLQGQRYWDAVRNLKEPTVRHEQTDSALTFRGETDRVYAASHAPMTLTQSAVNPLVVTQSAHFTETVVWNPGQDLCANIADLPAEGYQHMLCVEAAKIDHPVTLQPGEAWQGWQQLTAA